MVASVRMVGEPRKTHKFLMWGVERDAGAPTGVGKRSDSAGTTMIGSVVFTSDGLCATGPGNFFLDTEAQLGGIMDCMVENWHLFFEALAFLF